MEMTNVIFKEKAKASFKDTNSSSDEADISSTESIDFGETEDVNEEKHLCLGSDDVNEFFGDSDQHHLLYILEMILSFYAWYKCGAPYSMGTNKGCCHS